MPAFGNVVLTVDSVAHTYVPSSLTDGQGVNIDRTTSSAPAGWQTMIRKTQGPSNGNGLYRVKLKLNDPVVVAADSACGCTGTLDYTNSVSIEFVLSEKSTTAMRTALRKKAAALLADASVVAQVDNFEYIWG